MEFETVVYKISAGLSQLIGSSVENLFHPEGFHFAAGGMALPFENGEQRVSLNSASSCKTVGRTNKCGTQETMVPPDCACCAINGRLNPMVWQGRTLLVY